MPRSAKVWARSFKLGSVLLELCEEERKEVRRGEDRGGAERRRGRGERGGGAGRRIGW